MTGYRVDRELGRGGMAVVYAGRQAELDRPVALKVLAAHLADNHEFRQRFLREARIAARLHHPHIVQTYDITELDGLPCIVMELLPGGTLESGRLTREQAAEVADAVAHAHAHGVVHRDLKPANLLRAATGEVKIADFGIARAAEDTMLTQAGTVLGTLRYVAPEQAEGRPVGPEADVYSLGVLLRELVADADPALVEWCLRRDPRERPTAGQVVASLRGARRRTVSDTRSWLAGGGAAAAIVAAIALLVAQHHSSPRPVPPVPHAATAAQEARNLEAWLRRYSR
jgi:predicted Ser/Thr protein kinase